MIAGARWELTNNWNCGGNDIGFQLVLAWKEGQNGAIVDRKNCASKCLEHANCTAFTYPQNPGVRHCFWKYGLQKIDSRGTTCGSENRDWQLYSFLGPSDCYKHGNLINN